jgi:hypothetical protein
MGDMRMSNTWPNMRIIRVDNPLVLILLSPVIFADLVFAALFLAASFFVARPVLPRKRQRATSIPRASTASQTVSEELPIIEAPIMRDVIDADFRRL